VVVCMVVSAGVCCPHHASHDNSWRVS